MKASNIEIPTSHTLTHITSSKLRDFKTCERMFYWHYIRNIVSNTLNMPLTLGSIFHEGMAELFASKDINSAIAVVQSHVDTRCQIRANLTEDIEKLSNIEAQVIAMLTGWAQKKEQFLDELTVVATEQRFNINLAKIRAKDLAVELPTIPYVGTIDLLFDWKGKFYVGEHKTRAQFNDKMFDKLMMDLQVHMYPLGAKACTGKLADGVYYNIIRKTSLRQKQTESKEDYQQRIVLDYEEKPENYFIDKVIVFNRNYTDAVLNDIVIYARQLMNKYTDFGPNVSNMNCWARNDDACDKYSGCIYFPLCYFGAQTAQLRNYVLRDLRYPEEHGELY